MKRRLLLACLLASALAAAAPASAAGDNKAEEKKSEPKAAPRDDTFDQDSVLRDAEQFFGRSTEGLARVIVGLRAGASIGYMRYTAKKTYIPF